VKRKDFEAPLLTQREHAPQRWPSVASDVTVPFWQAVITGLLLATLVTGLIWGTLGNALANTLDISTARGAVSTFATVFSLGVIFAWFWRMGVVTDTLWAIEEALSVDLDRDGAVGKPQSIRLEIQQGNRTEFADIDGLEDLQRLRQFAILGLTNRLNERMVKKEFDWSREHWQGIRDDLISRDWATWGGGTESIRLTDQGQGVMREILDHAI